MCAIDGNSWVIQEVGLVDKDAPNDALPYAGPPFA